MLCNGNVFCYRFHPRPLPLSLPLRIIRPFLLATAPVHWTNWSRQTQPRFRIKINWIISSVFILFCVCLVESPQRPKVQTANGRIKWITWKRMGHKTTWIATHKLSAYCTNSECVMPGARGSQFAPNTSAWCVSGVICVSFSGQMWTETRAREAESESEVRRQTFCIVDRFYGHCECECEWMRDSSFELIYLHRNREGIQTLIQFKIVQYITRPTHFGSILLSFPSALSLLLLLPFRRRIKCWMFLSDNNDGCTSQAHHSSHVVVQRPPMPPHTTRYTRS